MQARQELAALLLQQPHLQHRQAHPGALTEKQQPGQQEQPLLPQQQPLQPPPSAVLFGTCGWSDASLVRCGRFYPPGVRSSEEKLRHYSRHFGCVEVDTSCYAIPRPEVTARWAQSTVPGFKFHVKAFGLFAAASCQVSSLPAEARALLPPAQQAAQHVRLGSMPAAAEDACWRLFHAALEPLYRAGRLGAVVFQFHLSFAPSQQKLEYILRCRRRLDPRFQMAAEMRCRQWVTDPAWRRQLCDALSCQGVSLVSADELEHENAQKDREQAGLPPGTVRRVAPIALEVTTPAWHYVRVHRRHGTTDRLLSGAEVEGWAARLAHHLAPRLQGPVYFLLGTDWEDVPMRNARSLGQALPAALRFDWRQHCRAADQPRRGSIQSLFAAKAAGATAMAATAKGVAPAAQPATAPAGEAPGQRSSCEAACLKAHSAALPPHLSTQEAAAGQAQQPLLQQAQQQQRPAAGRKRGLEGAVMQPARKSGPGSILRFLQRPDVTEGH